jgi:hypothetical protein
MDKNIHRFINSFGFRAFKLALAVGLLVILTLFIGFRSTAFTGFPKGYDAFNHLALAQIVKENFPHVLWNPYWDGGVVLFPRNYPPLFHFGVGLIALAFSLEVTLVAKAILALSIILTAIFLFLCLWVLTKKILPGLFAGLFFLASSTVWCYILTEGLYPRVMAMMTVSLVILSLVLFKVRPSFATSAAEAKKVEKATKGKSRAYYLLVFALVLAYLTHFLSAILASIFVLVFLLFSRQKWQEKLKEGVKIFLPVLGLSAFYYLPVIVLRPGRLGLLTGVGKGEYEPWAFLSLLKQGYPGLPFLSVPLGVFVFVLVILLRYKFSQKQKQIFRFFLSLGILGLACLLYVLGAYSFTFYGIYPAQFLLPSVLFLSLFLGLGLFFLKELAIIKKFLFLILLGGLTSMSLLQTGNLEKMTIDQSRVYRRLTFEGMDEERLYRFAHREEILGGAFNFHSQTLQTRGYYEPGVLHRDFYQWFERAVFMTAGNPAETKFLFNWYGVKNFYTFHRDLKGGGLTAVQAKFVTEPDFAQVRGSEYYYQKAQPILMATKATVKIVKERRDYFDLLTDLAEKGIDSQSLIPILSRTARAEEFSAGKPFELPQGKGQKAEFVNSHKRVIELEEYFPGVLLKEAYYRNWNASLLKTEDGKLKTEGLPVYFAGPGMMYVSLPKEYDLPAKVVFEYKMSWVEWMGWGISLLSLVGLIFRKRIKKLRFNKSIIQLFKK